MASFATTSSAQTYKPMLTEGKVWECSDGYGQDFTISVEGDTIADGKKMKKLVYRDAEGNVTDNIAALEEEGKVYSFFARYDAEDPNKEELTLMYDLGWNVGDKTFQGVVTATDIIEAQGVKRKRITVGSGDNSTYIVEGVGANWQWFFSGVAPDANGSRYDYVQHIKSCYENGNLIFEQADFEATPITAVDAVETDNKVNAAMYDTTGMRLYNTVTKGKIYIKSGKKLIQH